MMFNETEQKIIQILNEIAASDRAAGGLRDKEWTIRVKEALCELGHNFGFGVSASCKTADTGEWLFDLIWADGRDSPWQFWEMPLAMECEWNCSAEEIIYDFEKLLVAKTQYKLMVFQQAIESDVRNIARDLKERINAFKTKLPGERYLLAGYAFDERKFFYEVA